MKHTFILFLLLFCGGALWAQPVITNASFPAIGDTLSTSTDVAPSISLGMAGANQTWDFSGLSSTQVSEMVIYNADTSTLAAQNFPSADAFINVAGGQFFLEYTPNKIKQLGLAGSIMGVDLVTPLSPQGNFRFAPIQYGGEYSNELGFSTTIGADQLPLDSLNLPIEPDSLRLTQSIVTSYEADAWGELTIPAGTYDVLRLKRVQTTNSTLEALVVIGGILPTWITVDPTSIPNLDNLGEFSQFLIGGAVESYEFLAEGVKESIAVVTMDSVGGSIPVSVAYKAGTSGTVSVVETGSIQQVFNAFPNPAYKDVRIDIQGFPRGNYDLNIYNLTGKKVYSKALALHRDTAVTLNVSTLPRGTYLYALQDKDGKIIKTNRLVVVKP